MFSCGVARLDAGYGLFQRGALRGELGTSSRLRGVVAAASEDAARAVVDAVPRGDAPIRETGHDAGEQRFEVHHGKHDRHGADAVSGSDLSFHTLT